jgi:hypothetical protein
MTMTTASPTAKAQSILIAALLAACAYGAACNGSNGARDAGGGSGGGGSGGTGGSPTGACAGTLNGSCKLNAALAECYEYYALPNSGAVATIESMCVEDGRGTWTDGAPCNRTAAIGGCRQMQDPACLVEWRFQGDATDLMSDCVADGDTWISP